MVWEFSVFGFPVGILMNVILIQAFGGIFGFGLAGYLTTPVEFELSVKRSLRISRAVYELTRETEHSDGDVEGMLERLYDGDNSISSPPEDWPYTISAVSIYEYAEEIDTPTPFTPTTTKSQKIWMVVGAALLPFGLVLPFLNNAAVALPVILSIVLGYSLFTWGFNGSRSEHWEENNTY